MISIISFYIVASSLQDIGYLAVFAIETLSKIFYPAQFKDIDPLADYHTLITRFTDIPDHKVILSYTLEK